MTSVLKEVWTIFRAGMKQNRPGRHDNLKLKILHGEHDDRQLLPFILPVRSAIQNHQFPEAAKMIDGYLNQEIFAEDGRTLFSVAAAEFCKNFGDETDSIPANLTLLKLYVDWYNNHAECPYAAASLALALRYTGHSHRGTGWAKDVKSEQWEAMFTFNAKAAEVFNSTRSQFENHWYWSKVYMGAALTDQVEPAEIWRRFGMAVAANPNDGHVYTQMAYMMLPRWHGSFDQVEKVALRASELTQTRYGDMMYARTLSSVYAFHHLDELQFDWAKLRKGYVDWLNLYPSDYVKTLFATALYSMREYDDALYILESIDVLHAEAWHLDEELTLVNSYCQEMMTRRAS